MRWNLHTDINVTKEWLEIEEQGFDDDNIYTWGFVIKETGELIDSGGLVYKDELQLFELGYNIMKKLGFQYQGEGKYSSFDNTRTFTTKDYIIHISE